MSVDSAVATRIRTALAQHLKRDVSKIRLEDSLRADLGLDSLAMIELLFKIEEAFDLEIPNDDLSKITTVGDVVTYVEERLGSSAAAAAPRPAPMARPVVATSSRAVPTTPPAANVGAKRAAPPVKLAKRAGAKKKGSRPA
jgi:acyl carrier protein